MMAGPSFGSAVAVSQGAGELELGMSDFLGGIFGAWHCCAGAMHHGGDAPRWGGDAPRGVGDAPQWATRRVGDAPRRPYVAMLGMGMDGCAGGVAPLRPYDMVGRGFRCFACASMTAPFLSPARGGIRRGLPPQQLMMAEPSFGLGQTAASQEAGGRSLPACGEGRGGAGRGGAGRGSCPTHSHQHRCCFPGGEGRGAQL